MNPGRFYIPGYMGMRSGSFISPMIRMTNRTTGNMGYFSKITNSIKSVNWSGLLSGANKTLSVVNQTIPLVRQAGPMVNNMRSMLRIAKAFGSETIEGGSRKKNINDNLKKHNSDVLVNNNNINVLSNTNTSNYDNSNYFVQKKEVYDDNYPNFFV